MFSNFFVLNSFVVLIKGIVYSEIYVLVYMLNLFGIFIWIIKNYLIRLIFVSIENFSWC